MHYFNDGCKFVLSGKAVRSDNSCTLSGIVQRNEGGHKKKSALYSLANGKCFYTLFPSLANSNQLSNKWGNFEDLTLYSGFCFNRKNNTVKLTSVEEGKCIFDWSLYINHLTRTNICGCSTSQKITQQPLNYFL